MVKIEIMVNLKSIFCNSDYRFNSCQLINSNPIPILGPLQLTIRLFVHPFEFHLPHQLVANDTMWCTCRRACAHAIAKQLSHCVCIRVCVYTYTYVSTCTHVYACTHGRLWNNLNNRMVVQPVPIAQQLLSISCLIRNSDKPLYYKGLHINACLCRN